MSIVKTSNAIETVNAHREAAASLGFTPQMAMGALLRIAGIRKATAGGRLTEEALHEIEEWVNNAPVTDAVKAAAHGYCEATAIQGRRGSFGRRGYTYEQSGACEVREGKSGHYLLPTWEAVLAWGAMIGADKVEAVMEENAGLLRTRYVETATGMKYRQVAEAFPALTAEGGHGSKARALARKNGLPVEEVNLDNLDNLDTSAMEPASKAAGVAIAAAPAKPQIEPMLLLKTLVGAGMTFDAAYELANQTHESPLALVKALVEGGLAFDAAYEIANAF